MKGKRGPEKQYASERERNRAKQKRHRDKINSVTLTATNARVARRLRAADFCVKCNDLTLKYQRPVVCPVHAKAVEAGLGALRLSENRATHLNTNDIVTGTDIARVSAARAIEHGRSTGGRITARVDMLPDVLQVQGLVVTDEVIKTILPWFTELVADLWDTTLELNPHLTVEDLMAIIPQVAAGMLANELHQPKEKQSWHSQQSNTKA
jgi:hypothetical protein